jgi:hypothetical protein
MLRVFLKKEDGVGEGGKAYVGLRGFGYRA